MWRNMKDGMWKRGLEKSSSLVMDCVPLSIHDDEQSRPQEFCHAASSHVSERRDVTHWMSSLLRV